MKLYRNSPWTNADSSHGFRWFATKREATDEAKENASEYEETDFAKVAEEFSIPPMKSNILELLRRVAEHPDNG